MKGSTARKILKFYVILGWFIVLFFISISVYLLINSFFTDWKGTLLTIIVVILFTFFVGLFIEAIKDKDNKG